MNIKKVDHKEVALRSLFILLVIGLILGYSKDKILIAFNFKQADPDANIVSLNIHPLTQFPVWPSFMCGEGLTNVIAQAVKRGKSGAPDELTDLPNEYIKPSSTGSLSPGDWTGGTGLWPCFEFNSNKQLNFTPGVIDQVILKASSNQLPVGNAPISQTGLLFGIFDAVRTMNTVDPFVAPIPSRNTFTFTKNERYPVNGTYETYFFVNKQNIISTPLNDGNTVATFAYSPDTFVVMTYREQKPFTPYGLISSVGGFITYAVAAWVILFGRGKYRSWGLIQRYLLRNSPDATKNDNNNRLFPVSNEKSKPSDIESQTQLVAKSSENDESFRPTSTFYFGPNQQNFNPLSSPNSVITSSSLQSKDLKDLNKLIDAKINQKLWFVEQTLSRHYLSGFRLRRYDVDPNKLGTPYDEVDELLTPPTARHSWHNLDSGINYRDSRNGQNTPPPPHPPPPQNLSHYSSQHFQKNNNSVSSFNPEEQRQQYPNVAVGQIPFEKKQKGSGIFQYSNDTATTGIVNNAHNAYNAHDGNYLSNVSVSMPPSSYIPNVPSYSDNSNIQSPLSQLQTSLPQGNHYMNFSNSQGQNQGSLRGPEER